MVPTACVGSEKSIPIFSISSWAILFISSILSATKRAFQLTPHEEVAGHTTSAGSAQGPDKPCRFLPPRRRAACGNLPACPRYRSDRFGRLVNARKCFDQGRFASPVVAQKRVHFTRVDFEVNPGQGRKWPKLLGPDFQRGDMARP